MQEGCSNEDTESQNIQQANVKEVFSHLNLVCETLGHALSQISTAAHARAHLSLFSLDYSSTSPFSSSFLSLLCSWSCSLGHFLMLKPNFFWFLAALDFHLKASPPHSWTLIVFKKTLAAQAELNICNQQSRKKKTLVVFGTRYLVLNT